VPPLLQPEVARADASWPKPLLFLSQTFGAPLRYFLVSLCLLKGHDLFSRRGNERHQVQDGRILVGLRPSRCGDPTFTSLPKLAKVVPYLELSRPWLFAIFAQTGLQLEIVSCAFIPAGCDAVPVPAGVGSSCYGLLGEAAAKQQRRNS
jgi:hypothetical protein